MLHERMSALGPVEIPDRSRSPTPARPEAQAGAARARDDRPARGGGAEA